MKQSSGIDVYILTRAVRAMSLNKHSPLTTFRSLVTFPYYDNNKQQTECGFSHIHMLTMPKPRHWWSLWLCYRLNKIKIKSKTIFSLSLSLSIFITHIMWLYWLSRRIKQFKWWYLIIWYSTSIIYFDQMCTVLSTKMINKTSHI